MKRRKVKVTSPDGNEALADALLVHLVIGTMYGDSESPAHQTGNINRREQWTARCAEATHRANELESLLREAAERRSNERPKFCTKPDRHGLVVIDLFLFGSIEDVCVDLGAGGVVANSEV